MGRRCGSRPAPVERAWPPAAWPAPAGAPWPSLRPWSPPLELELVDQLAHGAGRLVERRLLLGRELDLDDLFDAAAPELDGHADVEPLHAILAVQEIGRASCRGRAGACEGA